MTDNRDLAVLIPLRGGSKGIHRKNVRPLAGKPLFCWTVEAALSIKVPIYISTEDSIIASQVAEHFPEVKILHRPLELATDEASTESVVHHFFENVQVDSLMLIQATSPLTTGDQLKAAVAEYYLNNRLPLVTCVRKHHFLWDERGYPQNYNPMDRPRRQQWPGVLVENGAFYIFARQSFLDTGCRCSPPVTIFEMPATHDLELDSASDWARMEYQILNKLNI